MEEHAQWPTGRLLSTAARLVEHAWDAELAAHGLTHSRLVVAHLLADGPATQRELARRADVQEQTMGRTVAGMAELGLLARERDPHDRRRSVVALTGPGRAALQRVLTAGGGEDLVRGVVDAGGGDSAALRTALVLLVDHFAARRWPTGGV